MVYYLTSQVQAALKTNRRWQFRYARVLLNAPDPTTEVQAENVISCTVSDNWLADKAKRTCDVQLPGGTTFNYLTHGLRAFAILLRDDGTVHQEFPVGTFMLSMPDSEPDDPRAPVRAQGFDYLLKAAEAKAATTTVFATTETVGSAVASLCAQAGYPKVNLPGTLYGITLVAATDWQVGTSILQMVNDLLTGANCTPLACDAYGVPYSRPYTDAAATTSIWNYTRDSSSVIIDRTTTVTLDLFDLPNQWLGVVSEPDRPELRTLITNTEASDPTSTVNRGRTITRVLTADELGKPQTQADLDNVVLRFRQEAYQQYLEVAFTTGIMPFHDTGDGLLLDYGYGVAEKFREVSWSMELKAGGQMKHVARRAVAIG